MDRKRIYMSTVEREDLISKNYTYKAETNLILNVFGHSFMHTGVYI